jgi:hypothetical protein
MSRRLKTVAIIPVMVVLGIAAYAGTAIRVCSFPKSHIVGEDADIYADLGFDRKETP